MFESIINFFRKLRKSNVKQVPSKETAKERLHLVLMQDRANVSVDFLELMKQEIIEVIKKYIEIDESAIDVRLTNEVGDDGTQRIPSLYANIPILAIKNDVKDGGTEHTNTISSDTPQKKDKNKTKNVSLADAKSEPSFNKESTVKAPSSGTSQKKDKKETKNVPSSDTRSKPSINKKGTKNVPSADARSKLSTNKDGCVGAVSSGNPQKKDNKKSTSKKGKLEQKVRQVNESGDRTKTEKTKSKSNNTKK